MNIGLGIRVGQRTLGGAPALVSAVIENAAPANVVLTFDKTVTGVVAADFTLAGKTISNCVIADSVVTLTVSVAYEFGDVVAVTYVKDGGNVESFTGQSVTNNITLDAAAATYITNNSVTEVQQKRALDYVVKALKAESMWDDIVSFFPFIESRSANLKNPSKNGTVVENEQLVTIDKYHVGNFGLIISPSERTSIKSGISPSADLVVNNNQVSYWIFRERAGVSGIDYGCAGTYPVAFYGSTWMNISGTYYIISRNDRENINQTVYLSNTAKLPGLYLFNRSAVNLFDAVRNGTVIDTETNNAGGSLPSEELRIGGLSSAGVSNSYCGAYFGCFIVGKSIAPAKYSTYNTIITEFIKKKTKNLTAFFGDSITNSYNVTAGQGFPDLLVSNSNIRKYNVRGSNGFRMQNTGNNNYSYYYTLASYIADTTTVYPYAIGSESSYAIFEFGVNDCGYNDVSSAAGGTTPNTTTAFTTQYGAVLDYFLNVLKYPANRIILLGMTYVNSDGWQSYNTAYGSTPADETRALSFDTAISNLATAKSVNFVSLYAGMKAQGNTYLQADGLHPNAAGHAYIAAQIAAQVTNFGA